jgi:hypothetical protein
MHVQPGARQLGALGDQALEGLAEYAAPRILDPRGVPSGTVRPVFELAGA